MCRLILMIVIIAFGGLGSALAGDNVIETDDVLEQYVEAVGGHGALDSLALRIYEGRFIDDRPYRGPATETVCLIRAQAGRALEIVMNGVVRTEGSSVAGERRKMSWLLDPRGPTTVAADFPGLRYDGDVLIDGAYAHRLISDRDPDHYALHFDVVSGLLVRIGHYLTVGDYREVDGVMVPHRIVNSRKGGSNTWVFERVRHD